MHRRNFSLPRPALSREKNLVLILLAVLTAVLLWNTFWWLMRIVLFVVVVYTIYQILKHYIWKSCKLHWFSNIKVLPAIRPQRSGPFQILSGIQIKEG